MRKKGRKGETGDTNGHKQESCEDPISSSTHSSETRNSSQVCPLFSLMYSMTFGPGLFS